MIQVFLCVIIGCIFIIDIVFIKEMRIIFYYLVA